MNHAQTKTRQRVNITLSPETLRLIDRATDRGNRSGFISQAVRFYARQLGKNNLRQQLRERAIVRAEHDLATAQDWFPLENEVWFPEEKSI